MSAFDEEFEAMGTRIRVVVGRSEKPGLAPSREAGRDSVEFIRDFDRRLSRFRPDSELSVMNHHPDEEVPASELLRIAVKAGKWAARQSGGLVDPTLLDEIEQAGYGNSRAGMTGLATSEMLSGAPPRQVASPDSTNRWDDFEVDDQRGVIRRPAGLGFDTGGTGKGLAADLVVESLADYSRVMVSCGGDIRVGGRGARRSPFDVLIQNPVTGTRPHRMRLGSGGIATSGIDSRSWKRADGTAAHHLLDPATGKPCWSGLVGVTALGRTALEAETLAKTALLSGPDGARRILARHGGLMTHEDGRVESAKLAPAGIRMSRPGRIQARAA